MGLNIKWKEGERELDSRETERESERYIVTRRCSVGTKINSFA